MGFNLAATPKHVLCLRARPRLGDNMAEGTETYQGEFYCVKCKEKREAEGRVVETNGRRMAKGTCPVCGTNLNRILGKAPSA